MNKALLLCAALAASFSAMGAVPYSFTAGTAAKASEVNANFTYVEDRVSSVGISVRHRVATDVDGVTTASCAADETITGGGCDCTGYSSANEAGVLFACHPVINSYIGACYPLATAQATTPIDVYATCAKVGADPAAAPSAKPPVPQNLDEVMDAEQKLLNMIEGRKARQQ